MRTDSPERRCDKPNCGKPAAANFTFRYETSEVWVGDLVEPHPSRYDLCHAHAEQLTAPRGWQLIDDRDATVERLPFAAGAEQHEGQMAVGGGSAASTGPPRSAGRPGNRYAGLSAQLPRLAAEVHAGEEPGEEPPADGPPITSRELWPVSPDAPGGVVLDFDGPRERRDTASAQRRAAESHPAEGGGDAEAEDPTGDPAGEDSADPPPNPGPG